jgi:hypothetical protein
MKKKVTVTSLGLGIGYLLAWLTGVDQSIVTTIASLFGGN